MSISLLSSPTSFLETLSVRIFGETGTQASGPFLQVAAPNVVRGTSGNDVRTGTGGIDLMDGLGGHDRLSGGGGADIIGGSSGNDTLLGGSGNDILEGGSGNDILNGGIGSDTANFTGKTALKLDLNLRTAQRTGYGTDTFISIENVLGGSGNDVVKGNAAANILLGAGGRDRLSGERGKDVLSGGIGNDTLDGGSGNDALHGAQGTDILTGGTGRDSFYFDYGVQDKRVDTITDYNVAEDTMYLDKLFFTAFKKSGTMAASAFYKGAAAHDSNDRIIYNDKTGALYYDPDGTGKAGAILFAKIGIGLALTNADFIIG